MVGMKTFIIAAITADGFVGTDAHHLSTTWSTAADKQFFVQKTKEAGAAVFGRTTFDTFNRKLSDRRTIVLTTRPESITVKGVETTSESPADLIARLDREGQQTLAICGGANVYAQFLQQDLVDEIFLNVHPVLFGKGVPLLKDAVYRKLELLETKDIGDQTVLLHYRVLRDL